MRSRVYSVIAGDELAMDANAVSLPGETSILRCCRTYGATPGANGSGFGATWKAVRFCGSAESGLERTDGVCKPSWRGLVVRCGSTQHTEGWSDEHEVVAGTRPT